MIHNNYTRYRQHHEISVITVQITSVELYHNIPCSKHTLFATGDIIVQTATSGFNLSDFFNLIFIIDWKNLTGWYKLIHGSPYRLLYRYKYFARTVDTNCRIQKHYLMLLIIILILLWIVVMSIKIKVEVINLVTINVSFTSLSAAVSHTCIFFVN